MFKQFVMGVQSIYSFKLSSLVFLNTDGAPIIFLLGIIVELNKFLLDPIEQTYFSSEILLLIFVIH